MKEYIKKFHLENKEIIDVTTVVFVITGLVLNINPENQLRKISIGQVDFFLLSLSIILLIYLLYQSFIFFIQPLLNTGLQSNQIDPHKKLKEEIFNITKILLPILFIFLLILLFVINLIVYLILTFPRESLFLVASVFSYLLFFGFGLTVPSQKAWIQNIFGVLWIILAVVLLLIIPIYLYLEGSWLSLK
ncbi:MAG: hypothetical protein QG589_79 [Patescibacteria group bacterium]|jgi:hypothetical protein|nr:hypothetical protein [Patescibacteria group bacterium]